LDVIAEWRSWAQVLRLPLLVGEQDGALYEAIPQLGLLQVWSPATRRRRRGSVQKRRPRFLTRRQVGRGLAAVHRGEREIIAWR
jgi:hypothetical protein